MGWWKTMSGCVIGDAAADYIEGFGPEAERWIEPHDLPAKVRARLDLLYVEGIGREPTEHELSALLAFCR